FWETPADGTFIGNRHYRLANLVRASTAAPAYFDPEELPIVEGALAGLFVDGGVTPHNNPALALYLLCTLKAHGLCCASDPSRLLMTSIGTGAYRSPLTAAQARRIRAIGLAIRALSTLINDSENLVLTLMQWLAECPTPWPVNSEVGALIGDGPPGGK